MEGRRLYPIGIQTFSKLREGNYVYVDKTELVYRMTHGASGYIFLSRPRRFGKSLLTSTLHSYFEGRKELFEGLAIECLEKEWTSYPVLHFDMSTAKHMDKDRLLSELERKLYGYEQIYGRDESAIYTNQRLESLIKRAYAQTGQKVVVLIDEYDAPLLDVVHEEKELPKLRDVMRNFYSPLKACDPYLRFVFLTGITKFSQLSIFSELNNIKNISMLPEYASLCGITEEEMREQMGEDIGRLADNLGVTPEGALGALKSNYDGYHFTWPSPDIYNPFSLLNALADSRLDSYWFGSGTPTYLIEMLRKYHVIPQEIGNRRCVAADFDAPTERVTSVTPLLYQSGYITIKGYSRFGSLYTLDIPNKEVRIGLMRSLLPNYVRHPAELNTLVVDMAEKIYNGDMEGGLCLLRTYLSTIPYCDNTHYEGHYQQLFYVIFTLIGNYVDVEVRTPKGRVDMVLHTPGTLYVVELKIDGSADAAMNQIDLKEYPGRFALCGLPIVKVGINFDSEKRTIEGWRIEKV
ncbi:ATP-binding protein [Parabacteroides sp.]|uniref:ATP-binding protein n=1 Tax=Parabacteroides sp. TaxID=1869337 RepID=UPI0026E06557|nr:ATP-binding protein [Parabacteroides sp.]MDO5430483.1 AAA family ATPase [Parabacteroides sp.]